MRFKIYIILLYFNLISCFGLFTFNFLSCGNRNKQNGHCNLVNSSKSNVDNRMVHYNSVVFLGDSFTDFGVWQTFFPNVQTANQGIGGETSADVLHRLDSVLL